jgi:hypothetical protein
VAEDRRRPRPDVVQRLAVDSGDLFKSVDALLRSPKLPVLRGQVGEKLRKEWVPTRSLYDQLLAAQASDNAGGERGKAAPGSRAPLDLTITALLGDITTSVINTLVAHGEQPYYRAGDLRARGLGIRLFDVPASLRHLAVVVRDLGDQALADYWARRLHSWVGRAKQALALDEDDTLVEVAVRLPGIGYPPCPNCGERTVTTERDGEQRRDSALVTQFRDGQLVHVTCRACSTGWWRGEEVEALTELLRPTDPDTPSTDDVTGSEDPEAVPSDTWRTAMPEDGRSRPDRLPPSSLFPW